MVNYPFPKHTRTHQFLLGGAVWRTYWQWLTLAAVASAAIVLGLIGLNDYFTAAGTPRSYWDLCYFVLHLFVVESGEVSGSVPWQLTVARFLAPLVPAWAIVQATAIIFRKQFDLLRLRMARGHVVICGLGQRGMQFANDFRRQGYRVVGIEMDGQNPAIHACRELGVLVLIGDAKDALLLHKARVHCAKYVLAVCDNDGANIEITIHTHLLVHAKRVVLCQMVKCFVHVLDIRLCEAFRHHRVFADATDRFEAHIFNSYENSARRFLADHPLDRHQIQGDSPLEVRLAVIGFGWMGDSVVLQAARTAHYANGKWLRVLVIDLEAEKRKKDFFRRFPQFEQICVQEFIEGDINDQETLARVCDWVRFPNTLATVAVCLEEESLALSCALDLQAKLDDSHVPIFVRMSDDKGLATVLDARDGKPFWSVSVNPFGMNCSSCTMGVLVDEELDELAKAIHRSYVEEQQKIGTPATDPAMQTWERLDHDLRESNRQQADHIAVKLRAIGCYSSSTIEGLMPVDELTDNEIEPLAKMEHARFKAERFLAGWTLTRGPRDVARRFSPYLVSWEELSENIKAYDRDFARRIPHFLDMIGQKVYRQPSGKEPAPTAPAEKQPGGN